MTPKPYPKQAFFLLALSTPQPVSLLIRLPYPHFSMDYLNLLKQNEQLAHLPDDALQFIVDKAEVKSYEKGDFLFKKGDPADHLVIICSGRFRVYLSQKDEQIEVIRLQPGDITGVLPYSRMTHAGAYGQAQEAGEVLRMHKSHFREMITTQHTLTEALVHMMSSRIREFTTNSMQNEKLMSLGKLSAGLAHELNNPAAAMVRSSAALLKHLKLLPENFKNVLNLKVRPQAVEAVSQLIFEIVERPEVSLPLMERTAREDELADQLDAFAYEDALQTAEDLVEFNMTAEDLLRLHDIAGPESFAPTLLWIVNNLITEKSVAEINASAVRISELIGSIKEYSHMDRSKDRQPVDINHGLQSTLKMLAHKARANKVLINEELDPNLPEISGFPGELNQVWTNFIDNALDAMETTGGTLTVKTTWCDPGVEVIIADTGTGIPEEVKNHIFDPFFTTKSVGKGTGLGLDIANKIIQRHKARVAVQSVPGATEFKVTIPTTQP